MTKDSTFREIDRPQRLRYAIAALLCGIASIIAFPLRSVLDLANIVMIFLLAVFLAAIRLGRGPAVMASFLSVGMFDFFFVPPHLSFAVEDVQYLVTFAVMLAVGLVTTHLTARLSEQSVEAQLSERATHDLYEVARELAGALSLDQVIEAVQRYLAVRCLKGQILLGDHAGKLASHSRADHTLGAVEISFADAAYTRNEVIEVDSLAGTGIAIAFLPLRAPTRTRGVLAITPPTDDVHSLRQSRPALEALASLVALAIERLHYVDVAQQAELQFNEERLRNSVLSSLSHDLRTPLTTLVGLADALTATPDLSTGGGVATVEAAEIIRDQAHAMHKLLTNVLDMARLQSSETVLNKEWQPIEDVVGSSLRLINPSLGSRVVTTSISPELPLCLFDAVLIERVLCNLLDNAVKFSPDTTRICISAHVLDESLAVSVANDGSHFPMDRADDVFRVFVRGDQESSIPGVGLGLTICKAIVEAHGGRIWVKDSDDGACVCFTLPSGTPPSFENESA